VSAAGLGWRGGGGWVPPPSSHARAFMSIQPLQQTGAADGLSGYNVAQRPRQLSLVVRVRHEVAGGIVTLSCHPRFCPRYPIGTCVAGNGGVRSSRDNVSSPRRGGRERVSRPGDCQHQGGRGLGWGGMVNPGEASVNVVTKDKPKVLSQNGDSRARLGAAAKSGL